MRRWTVLLVDGSNGRTFPVASGRSRFRALAVMAICLLSRPSERHELHWRSVGPYWEAGEKK